MFKRIQTSNDRLTGRITGLMNDLLFMHLYRITSCVVKNVPLRNGNHICSTVNVCIGC